MTKTGVLTTLLIGVLLIPAICEGRKHTCFALEDNNFQYVCEESGCKIFKPASGKGFCFAGRREIEMPLANGEVLCCTKDQGLKAVPKDKDDRVACTSTEIQTLYTYVGEAKVKQEIADCRAREVAKRAADASPVGKQKEEPGPLELACVPEFCCMLNTCYYGIVNKNNAESIACTATKVDEKPIVEYFGGKKYRKVCKDLGCFVAVLDPDEEISCPKWDPTQVSLTQRIGERKTRPGLTRGPDAAPVTIVEFSDFQCPYCVRAEKTVKTLLEAEEYRGKIKLVYRDYPLPSHEFAAKAAEAAHCAGDQGKYWEMHDTLFAASPQLKVADLKGYARELHLDVPRFEQCLVSGVKSTLVLDDVRAGEEAGVSATPTFFINGQVLSGAQPLQAFKAVIDAELAAKSATSSKIGQAPAADAGAGSIRARR